ncbi:MAG TPA: hypothetical protein VF221_17530 [Chloroflexota bacterium]
MDASDNHARDELTPEGRELMSRFALGRGLLRIGDQDPKEFWRKREGRRSIVTVLGSFAVYLVVVQRVRIPLIRQLISITVVMFSFWIWRVLYTVVVMLLLGWRRGTEHDPPS